MAASLCVRHVRFVNCVSRTVPLFVTYRMLSSNGIMSQVHGIRPTTSSQGRHPVRRTCADDTSTRVEVNHDAPSPNFQRPQHNPTRFDPSHHGPPAPYQVRTRCGHAAIWFGRTRSTLDLRFTFPIAPSPIMRWAGICFLRSPTQPQIEGIYHVEETPPWNMKLN